MCLIYPVIALMSVLAVTACSTHSGAHRDKQNLAAKDYTLTYEQVREAAQDGDADAQYALGYMYYYGQNVTRNNQQAQFWIRKAAAQKHPQAVKAIAIMGRDSQLAYRDHESADTDAVQVTPIRDLAKGQNKWEEVRRPNEVAVQTEQWGRRGQKNADPTPDVDTETRDKTNTDSLTSGLSARHNQDSLKAENGQATGQSSNRTTTLSKNVAHAGKKHARTVALKNKHDKRLVSHAPNAKGHTQLAKTPHEDLTTQADATQANADDPIGAEDSNESADNKTPAGHTGSENQHDAPKNSAQAEPMLQLAQERNTAPRSFKRMSQHSPKSTKGQKLAKAEHAKKPAIASSKANGGLASKGKLSADERSILSAPSSHYTLQLIGTGSEANIQQLIERNHLQHKAKMYRTQLKGKNFYVLIYGSYPSQSEANAEIARLPANVQQLKPWVKQYSSIKASVNPKSS